MGAAQVKVPPSGEVAVSGGLDRQPCKMGPFGQPRHSKLADSGVPI